MAASVEELALDESLRAIEHQEGTLDGLRTRAGVLLTAAALITSVFGKGPLDDTFATAGGLTLFVVVLGFVGYILWPREWTFANSASVILRNQKRAAAPLRTHQAFLALQLEQHYDKNQLKINTLTRAFRCGSIALVLEIGVWLIPA